MFVSIFVHDIGISLLMKAEDLVVMYRTICFFQREIDVMLVDKFTNSANSQIGKIYSINSQIVENILTCPIYIP